MTTPPPSTNPPVEPESGDGTDRGAEEPPRAADHPAASKPDGGADKPATKQAKPDGGADKHTAKPATKQAKPDGSAGKPDAKQAKPAKPDEGTPKPSKKPTKPNDAEPTCSGRSSRLTRRLNRAWCFTRTWIASTPAATTCAVVVLVLGFLGQLLVPAGALDAFADRPQRVWTLVTAWAAPSHPFVSNHVMPLLGIVVLVTVGALLERLMGTRRWIVSGLASTAGGIVLLQAIFPLLRATWPTWSDQLSHAPIQDVGLLVVGLLAAGSGTMNPLWRSRTRVLLFTFLILTAAVSGKVVALARVTVALVGFLVGLTFQRGEKSAPAQALPRRGERHLLALLVTCWSVCTVLATLSTATGPLAGARYGLTPAVLAPYLSGVGDLSLACMPALLQLALADGLRRGRRAAAYGTVCLQVFLALCTILSALTEQINADQFETLPHDSQLHGWFSSSHLAVPLLLNVVVILLVVWNRQHLTKRSRPGVVRQAVTAWGLTVAGGAVASVVLGVMASDFFSSPLPWSTLLIGYVVHLLPTSAAGFLGAYTEPRTAVAHVIIEGVPLVVWVLSVLWVWLALVSPARTESASHEDLKALVRSRGAGTLGWMLTWPGNEAWLNEAGTAGFAYRAGSGVALTLGNPGAAPEDVPDAVREFADFAVDAGMVPALYSVHAPAMAAARSMGWTVLQVAEEAVMDLPDLAFRGKAFQDVRTALNHAKREGITAEWTTWRTAPEGRRDQIRAISQGWVGNKALPEMGFTLGGLPEIDDDDTRLLLAVDESGTVHAVTSWMPVHRDGEVVGLTLDLMRRREGGWRPAIEYLIGRAAQDAQAEGLEIMSLSGAPLARSGTSGDLTGDGVDDVGASRFDPLLDLLASLLEPAYGFRSLHSFKRKFKPRKVAMYLAVPDVVNLPAVGVAIARAYVPDLTPAQTARFAHVLVTHD